MGDLITGGSNGLIGFFHGKDDGLIIPKPFATDILLIETHIAGTTYIEGIEELVEYLHIDDRLDLLREVDNKFDKYAIIIKTIDGVKLGYVPRKDNIILSRLMDAGKLLYAKIISKKHIDSWLNISIEIYMNE